MATRNVKKNENAEMADTHVTKVQKRQMFRKNAMDCTEVRITLSDPFLGRPIFSILPIEEFACTRNLFSIQSESGRYFPFHQHRRVERFASNPRDFDGQYYSSVLS